MCNCLRRQVAISPGTFIPESQTKTKSPKDWAFIFLFSLDEKGKVIRRSFKFECPSGTQAKNRAYSCLKRFNPGYLVAVHKYATKEPRIIFQQGDISLLDLWEKQNSQNPNLN